MSEGIVFFSSMAMGSFLFYRRRAHAETFSPYFHAETLESAHCLLLFFLGAWIKFLAYQGTDTVIYATLLEYGSPDLYAAGFLVLGLSSLYAMFARSALIRRVVALGSSILWAFLGWHYWEEWRHPLGVPLCVWLLLLNARVFSRIE